MSRQSRNLVIALSGFRGTLPGSMRANSQDGVLNPESGQLLPDLTCPRRRVMWNTRHLPSRFSRKQNGWADGMGPAQEGDMTATRER